MSVTAPPRPPAPERTASDGKPLDREEIEALVEALIEEARREQRRRRRRYWALAAVTTFVGVGLLILLDGWAASQPASPASAARPSSAAGAGRSQIAFTRDPAGPGDVGQAHKDLYIMNPDGSGLRLLAREVGLGEMAWSPDGREILYGGLSVVKADGSGERHLSDEAAYGFGWAPDGQQIAFTAVRGGYRDIYLVNSDGSGQRRIVKRGAYPSWSPDGRQIVFTSRRDANWEIYVINADGMGLRRLTRNPGLDWGPAWSPDGRTIFFGRSPDRGPPDVYVMNADGSGQRKWALNAWPVWSPDGRKIAFQRGSEIYVMNADGSGQRRLVRGGYGPVWSPDGRRIVYVRGQGPPLGKPDIYVMNADGSGQRRLLHTYVDSLAWSPAQR